MASTKNLREFLETASKEPKEQVVAGQVPMPPVLLFAPRHHAEDRLHTELLEMTGKIFLELGESLVKKRTYNQIDTADQVLQAMVDVANAAQTAIASEGSVSKLVDVRPSPNMSINRDIPREDLHRELLDVLFSHLIHDKRTLRDLDYLLQKFVNAFSQLPTDAEGKHIVFTFFVNEVDRNNIGTEQSPIYEDVQSIMLNTIRMPTEVYRDLVTKNEKPLKTPATNATSSKNGPERHAPTREQEAPRYSTEQRTSFLDMLRNALGAPDASESDNEPEPPEDKVTLKMDYRIITAKIKPKKFKKAQQDIDDSMRRVVKLGAKEYGERVTKVLYVLK
ncbi:unnamed protein product [Aspergillus oryzae RIB40]|uniref:Unnamed protein product n=2 Tax=Aspergillus oryzae TaxID=5062 RepID=A0A1S9D6U9_ASPOZ|nr:unnamed protein product [Aspergillus oryzae RIB40]OOO04825.1 hypothetical protein OAory_01111620 [Aspergillus oryzae]BAE64044.1 unnamed protein product [Aspergillus oryzae RIB40]GMG30373.1 unnamed protein product [Aspergillus oryzae]